MGTRERDVLTHTDQTSRTCLLCRFQSGRQAPRQWLIRQMRSHLEHSRELRAALVRFAVVYRGSEGPAKKSDLEIVTYRG